MEKKNLPLPGRRSGHRASMVEPLEGRVMLHTGPHVIDVAADNRGFVELKVDKALNATTVSRRSVQLYTAGPDGIFKTGDDVKQKINVRYASRRIYVEVDLPAYTSYRVVVKGSRITDKDGNLLDGEFNGPNDPSGNGTPGGNYKFLARKWSKAIARFTTVAGAIDVEMYKEEAPLTVRNFLKYSNRGLWDGTFFHRSMANFVVQGGGFHLDSKDQIDEIRQFDPVQNEFHHSNLRGTIAMAKLGGDPNSATNQWFFNLGNNSANLDGQNGGFTVFGRIANSRGLRVMDRIASYDVINPFQGSDPFDALPVRDAGKVFSRGSIDGDKDLILVSRVAMHMKIVKTA